MVCGSDLPVCGTTYLVELMLPNVGWMLVPESETSKLRRPWPKRLQTTWGEQLSSGDAGPLRIARYLEPFTLAMAQLAYEGDDGPEVAYRIERFGK